MVRRCNQPSKPTFPVLPWLGHCVYASGILARLGIEVMHFFSKCQIRSLNPGCLAKQTHHSQALGGYNPGSEIWILVVCKYA